MKNLKNILAEDVRAVYQGDPVSEGFEQIILGYPSIMAITTYRLAHELTQIYIQPLPFSP